MAWHPLVAVTVHLSELKIAARAEVSDLRESKHPLAMKVCCGSSHKATLARNKPLCRRAALADRILLMATSARGREENEELAPMTAWGCDKLRSAVKLCRTDHPSQAASPRVSNFSHGFKRTESLHVENLLDRSVTQVAAGLCSKGGARDPGYRRR